MEKKQFTLIQGGKLAAMPPAPKPMNPRELAVGDTVKDSPVGSGTITDFTEAGYPRVNHVAVARLIRTDGVVFDPYGSYKKEGR